MINWLPWEVEVGLPVGETVGVCVGDELGTNDGVFVGTQQKNCFWFKVEKTKTINLLPGLCPPLHASIEYTRLLVPETWISKSNIKQT